jgi:hypothetical protein
MQREDDERMKNQRSHEKSRVVHAKKISRGKVRREEPHLGTSSLPLNILIDQFSHEKRLLYHHEQIFLSQTPSLKAFATFIPFVTTFMEG